MENLLNIFVRSIFIDKPVIFTIHNVIQSFLFFRYIITIRCVCTGSVSIAAKNRDTKNRNSQHYTYYSFHILPDKKRD